MTWKKRIMSIALCLCALLCAASVRVDAETAHTDHLVCGGTTCDHESGTHITDKPNWTAWNGTDSITYTDNVAYVYLSSDVTLENANPLTVSTNQTLYLCLNGNSIKMKYNGGYWVIQVAGGNLVLCDCEGSGTVTQDTSNTSKNRGVKVSSGTFTMFGGSITGNNGGVEVQSNCTFTLYGGKITKNELKSSNSAMGGGVNVVSKGKFYMYGGEVSENSVMRTNDSTDASGGGVYNGGTFTMSGGEITNNTATGNGGGVYNNGTFTMSDGEITSNTATGDGGGVYGGLTMSSGKITSNKAANGGGVKAVGKAVQITDGEITGNIATGNGGGVCFYNSNLTISSTAKIANNKAADGGGVFFQGYTDSNTLTISDSAQITDNTATGNGGGVYISNNKKITFKLSGGIDINGNKKSVDESASTPNNIYLSSNNVITLAGTLTNTNKIGVTTENALSSGGYIDITKTNNDTNLVNAAIDKFAYENDTSKDIVTRSNGKILAVCDHVYDTTKWSSDETNHYHKCKNCDTTKDTTAHSYSSDWKTGNGNHWKECSICKDKKDLATHTNGTPVEENKNEATCTTAGSYDEVVYCTVCKTELSREHKTINPLGHTDGTPVKENVKAATCTAEGSYDEVVYCTVCKNEVSSEHKTIDKLAHDYDTTKWVKADENQHGHKCKNCDAITDLTAHTLDRDAPTETEAKVCKDCDWVIAPATHPEHTWVLVAGTPATCNATGEKEHYECDCRRKSVGNDYKVVADTELILAIDPTNHTGAPDSEWLSDSDTHWHEYTCCHAKANEAAHSGGAATCTAQAVCGVCGTPYGAVLGHDWGAWVVTTPATENAPGVETRTCTRDAAHTETRSIPKLSTAVYTVSEDTEIKQIKADVVGLSEILGLVENKQLIDAGKSVGVSLTVKNTASSGVSEKIKEKLAGSNLVGLRLELTVEKTVTENGAVVERENIPDTGVLLKTTITLPAELQGKSGYVVYRLHGDAVHVLTETPNANGEFITVSADKTQITICARLYSEYVIAYQTSGSSGGGYHPVNPTPAKATSANTGDAGVLLYGVTAALSLTGTAWLGAKGKKH